MKTITADVDYILGHLRYGHYELEVTDKEFEQFQNMSDADKAEYIEESGCLIIDDYDVDDIATPTNIKWYNSSSSFDND